MEKQPVDDLFHRKLHDAEVAPGADVFARLQSRMGSVPLPAEEPKRRVAGWWYGIAAASVLFILGWFGYKQLNVPNRTEQPTSQTAQANKTPVKEKTGEAAIAQQRTQPQSSRVSEQPREAKTGRTQLESKAVQPGVTTEPLVSAQKTERPTEQRTQIVGEGNKLAVERTPSAATQPDIVRPNIPDELVAKQEAPTNVVTTQPILPSQPVVKRNTERVVVMTIAEAAPINAVAQRTEAKDATPAQPGFAQLVAKVKQIKNGDVLVRATPAPRTSEPRTGIGRLFNGVKETLRNEATLEP